MADKDDPNLTVVGVRGAGEAARATVAQAMVDGGMDPIEAARRAHCKMEESKVWLRRAAWCFGLATVLAAIIVGVGLYVVVRVTLDSGSFPVMTAGIFGVAVLLVAGLPALAGLACATQASAEWVRTTLSFLPALGSLPIINKFFPKAST